MRAVALGAAAAVVLAAGCGGGREQPARAEAPLADRLEALCEEARRAAERLGEPRERGTAVFAPWARAGERFVARLRDLAPASAAERRLLDAAADGYAGFYAGLRLGGEQARAGESAAVKATLQHAYARLAAAEAAATELGAAACARRPFDDT